MIYQWKIPKYPVDAQQAGEEIMRISEKHGTLRPETVVEESHSEGAVLHDCFNWDDEDAAKKYRIMQSHDLIRNITTVKIHSKSLDEPVRAFVKIEKDYIPVSVVVQSREMTEVMLENALNELEVFRNKYASLLPLANLFDSIDALLENVNLVRV